MWLDVCNCVLVEVFEEVEVVYFDDGLFLYLMVCVVFDGVLVVCYVLVLMFKCGVFWWLVCKYDV